MGLIPAQSDLSRLTTDEWAARLDGSNKVAVLLPVGAVEAHGPHLGLITDVVISQAAAVHALTPLREAGVDGVIAPAIPYGVTECARAFSGSISVPAEVLTEFIASVIDSFLDDGVPVVCVVNNHLEPEHDAAVRAAVNEFGEASARVACPLTRRWGRTLSDEFKSGACHAGEYETSIVLASDPDLVRDSRSLLPEVPVSLSEKLKAGMTSFLEMGLKDAYAGAPAKASAEHGEQQLELLATMITTEVLEAIDLQMK